ncbi:8765_t:CDS:2 [Dentiscutata erythropus]|uniref:8765_t:CDS:1 n=1 Tax=Dentiscutata erythropus TaxID=1348616 RepID=A0A9N9IFJ9_9GLOM|nr:8765_t:CDS:2 [Dentiscutata erythropus]
MSLASASRKINSNGEGHRPDFMFTIDLNGNDKFEIVFGLFKSPSKANSQLVNIVLVNLGVLMKDSLDNIYNKGVELEIVNLYNGSVIDLSYDGVYRMFLLGEFELPRSNLSYCLRLVEEFIERFSRYRLTTFNRNKTTPTRKMQMIRKTLETPKKAGFILF